MFHRIRFLRLPGPRHANGRHQGRIDFNCNGALQKRYRKHKTMAAPHFRQNTFQTKQRTRFNPDPIASRQKWPRLMWRARRDDSVQRLDFRFVNGNWAILETHDLHHTRRLQYRKPILRIKAAEQVTREQWRVNFLYAIRPPFSHLVEGQKPLISPPRELLGDSRFVSRPNL